MNYVDYVLNIVIILIAFYYSMISIE